MTISIEKLPGGAAIELEKIRALRQDSARMDVIARDIGVGRAALSTMLDTEIARIAALT